MPKRKGEDFILVWEDAPYDEAHGTLRNVRRAVKSDLEEISLPKEKEMRTGVRKRVNVARGSAVPIVPDALSKEVALIEAHLPELLRAVLADATSEEG